MHNVPAYKEIRFTHIHCFVCYCVTCVTPCHEIAVASMFQDLGCVHCSLKDFERLNAEFLDPRIVTMNALCAYVFSRSDTQIYS